MINLKFRLIDRQGKIVSARSGSNFHSYIFKERRRNNMSNMSYCRFENTFHDIILEYGNLIEK